MVRLASNLEILEIFARESLGSGSIGGSAAALPIIDLPRTSRTLLPPNTII